MTIFIIITEAHEYCKKKSTKEITEMGNKALML